jgi:hypothetical protein
MALLNTRNGNYAAACGFDFMNPPFNHVSGPASRHPAGTYDDFATRDSNGNVLPTHLYPYFSPGKSQAALLSGKPIPVQSCWNGLGALRCLTLFSYPSATKVQEQETSVATVP